MARQVRSWWKRASAALRSLVEEPLRPGSVPEVRARSWGVLLAVCTGASVLLHLVAFLLVPAPRTSLPTHLTSEPAIEVLPPPEDPPPTVEVPPSPEPVPRPATPVSADGPPEPGGDTPTFVPHDVRPRLVNYTEVQRYLEIFYPVTFRAAGIEGAVHLWLFVDRQGRATKLQVRSSSGSAQFDELAKSAAPVMRFRPALNQGQPVGVWVSLWVRFDIEEPPADETQLAGTDAG